MQHKQIIITLIKDHLTNTCFIHGLNALGWHSQDYHLHLSDVIFKLVGIPDENEELFEAYLDWCTKMLKTEVLMDEQQLEAYATEIYHFLTEETE